MSLKSWIAERTGSNATVLYIFIGGAVAFILLIVLGNVLSGDSGPEAPPRSTVLPLPGVAIVAEGTIDVSSGRGLTFEVSSPGKPADRLLDDLARLFSERGWNLRPGFGLGRAYAATEPLSGTEPFDLYFEVQGPDTVLILVTPWVSDSD